MLVPQQLPEQLQPLIIVGGHGQRAAQGGTADLDPASVTPDPLVIPWL